MKSNRLVRRPHQLRLSSTVLPVLAATFFAACGGGGGSGGSGPTTSTFERIQTQVFDVSCSSDSCHSSVGRAGGLILEEGYSWDQLISKPPANPFAASHGFMRILPGEPDSSFIIAKLTNNLASGEGFAMPYNAAPLDEKTVDVMKAWIEAGAPAEGVVEGDDGSPLGGTTDDPTDIDLPPPARGVQIQITAAAVPVGQEETACHYLKLPSDVDLDVNRIQINVTGGSHHIHIYRPYETTDIPDHTEVCNFTVDFDKWSLVVASQLRKTDWELPQGVAYHFRAGEQLLVQTHFVNVGSLETIGEGKVVFNLHDADPGTVTAHAGALFGQDRDVFVPALTNTTRSSFCEFPKEINVFAETGHYHFRGRRFSTYLWEDGQRGAEVYRHEGYSDPLFLIHDPPLRLEPGQGLEWECYWENPNDIDYAFGPFTDINEHCNLFAFYYPTDSPNESITCVNEDGVDTTLVRTGD